MLDEINEINFFHLHCIFSDWNWDKSISILFYIFRLRDNWKNDLSDWFLMTSYCAVGYQESKTIKTKMWKKTHALRFHSFNTVLPILRHGISVYKILTIFSTWVQFLRSNKTLLNCFVFLNLKLKNRTNKKLPQNFPSAYKLGITIMRVVWLIRIQ